MDQQQPLAERLRAAPSAEKLAEQLTTEALDAPRAMVSTWIHGEPAESHKADFIVLALHELGIQPLLQEFRSANEKWRFRLMDMIVEQHLQLQKDILGELQPLLDDRSTIASEDEHGPARRVCDEAYVLMHQLLSIKETGLHAESEYLSQSNQDRDKDIRTLKGSKTWSALQEKQMNF